MNSKQMKLIKQLLISVAVLAGIMLSTPVIGGQINVFADTTTSGSTNTAVNTTFTGTMYRNTPSTSAITTPQTVNGFEHSLYFQAKDKDGNLQDSNYAIVKDNDDYKKSIINYDNYKDLTENFTITNNTSDDKIVNEIVALPKYDHDDTPLIFDNSRGHSTIAPESGSQSDLALTAYLNGNEYKLSEIPAGADWSTMDRFRVKGTLKPGQHWSIKIPLKLNLTGSTAIKDYLYNKKSDWQQITDFSYKPNSYYVLN